MTEPSGWLSFPDAPRIRTAPPGPRSRELLEVQRTSETDAVSYSRYFPIAVASARGSTIEDADGNRFIDWMAGISVLNLGHNHPRLAAALERQAGRVWHALELPTEARADFLRQMRDALPGSLRNRAKILFTVTGGDAVETAVSLADFATGRHGAIAFSGAYHGVQGGAVGLTSGRKFRETSAFGRGRVLRVPYPDPFRPVLDTDGDLDGTMRYLEHLLSDPYSGADRPSAVLVEPILGEGGYVVPPDDFLPRLREFCDRHGLLLILDEIQTGLGRTGKMWACEHTGVVPDILCIAKSIGGGIPLSLIAYRTDVVRELPPAFHIGTFRGNPLALAVGAEFLRTLREEGWVDRTARRGGALLTRFASLAARFPFIGDVRGKGFMIGIECVRHPRTKEPGTERSRAIRRGLFERGVLMHTCGPFDQTLRFMAPLTIEDELLDRGLTAFESVLEDLEVNPAFAGPAARAVRQPLAGPVIAMGPAPPVPLRPTPGPPVPGRTIFG